MPNSSDYEEMLAGLSRHQVKFLMVGEHAQSRYDPKCVPTSLDIWVRPDPDNAKRTYDALVDFEAPLHAFNVSPRDFTWAGTGFWFGGFQKITVRPIVPPISFDDAWAKHVPDRYGAHDFPTLSEANHRTVEREANRPKNTAEHSEERLRNVVEQLKAEQAVSRKTNVEEQQMPQTKKPDREIDR